MKLPADFWADYADLGLLFDAFDAAGHPLLFVGGFVRNLVMGRDQSDVDMSTDATPQQVMKLAKSAGLKSIPTGIDHGTVTVVVAGIPVEITTFRKDVETDGRRAVVAYSDNIHDDAMRRDLTMNALYADRAGHIIDPLGGLADAQVGRVRFIGDPAARITEDYLRILRFFRFFASYGQDGIDPDGLAACAELADGLSQISRERIGQEIVKILSAADPSMALAAMERSGVLAQVLPGAVTRYVPILIHNAAGNMPNPLARLAVMGDFDVKSTLRLSNKQADDYGAIRQHATDGTAPVVVGHMLGENLGIQALLVHCALMERTPTQHDYCEVRRGADATFPIVASDLMGDFQGSELGAALARAKRYWLDQGLNPTKKDILDMVYK